MGFRPLRQQIGRRARRALGALVAAALSGCVAGPNFIPPAAPGEAGYAMTGEETPAGVRLGQPLAGPWWSALGCAKLTATIDAALASSPTLAEAKARLSQARAVEAEARGAAYPEIDGNSGAQRERLNLSSFGLTSFPGISNNPTFNLYSVGATAAYLIPTTGLNRRRVESAQARAEARRHEGEAAVLTLSGQVAAAAAEIAAARAEIAADQAVIADDQRLVELARAAERAGGDAAGRRIGAQSALAADEAALPPVRQTLAAARHRLALLVGEPPSAMTPPDFDLADFHLPAEIPVSLPSELVRRRPDILQAEATAHAATAEVGVATAQLYPQINLTGSLAQNSLTLGSLFNSAANGYNLGLALTGPLFDGGRLRAARRASIAAKAEALAAYREVVLQAFVQISDLMQALIHDQEAITAEHRAAASAAQDLDLAQKGFGAGGLPLTPALDAERTLNAARRRETAARARYALDVISLFVASGADFTASPIRPGL